MFEIAAEQGVVHLGGAKLAPSARTLDAHGLGRHPCGPVGEADVAHFALTYDILERLDGFLDWRDGVDLVHQVHVDVVGAKAGEAAIHGLEDVTSRETGLDERRPHAIADLRRDHDFLALRSDRLAENALGLAAGVDVCRVEEVDAGVDGARHECVRACLIDFVDRREGAGRGPERHAAEGESRDD